MSRLFLTSGKLVGLVVLAVMVCVPVHGQTNSIGSVMSPPLPPPPQKSPVEVFRDLLGMTPVERRKALEGRTPENRKLILEKVDAYSKLQPEERELRLRVTELWWYLPPLLRTPLANRADRVAAIPSDMRKLVEDRLKFWDLLPPTLQKQLLDNEATLRFLTEMTGSTPEQKEHALQTLPSSRREQIEQGLRQWNQMTDEEREGIASSFNQYFLLTPNEQRGILHSISEPERVQIEKALTVYKHLPPSQRLQCLRSFQKFASLSPAERQQFLNNAKRWERMTPTERQTWKNLVQQMSMEPPLPTGRGPSPPLPPRPRAAIAPFPTATN